MFKNFLLAYLLFMNLTIFADVSQGESLEKEMWQYYKERKWIELENHIAPYFQAAYYDGAFDKEHYLIRAKTLNIDDFSLSNFKVTEAPGLIVVTYNIKTTETIEGKKITSNAVRLSVWQNNENKWQWIAHGIFIPVPREDKKAMEL